MPCELRSPASQREGVYGCASAIALLAAAVTPSVRCIRWGCPRLRYHHGHTLLIPLADGSTPPCRALATTALRSLRQQSLFPENDVSTTISSLGQRTTHLSSCPPSTIEQSRRWWYRISLPYHQRWLSPSPHRTSPCALLLVSAGL